MDELKEQPINPAKETQAPEHTVFNQTKTKLISERRRIRTNPVLSRRTRPR